jgi:hypothetical protein
MSFEQTIKALKTTTPPVEPPVSAQEDGQPVTPEPQQVAQLPEQPDNGTPSPEAEAAQPQKTDFELVLEKHGLKPNHIVKDYDSLVQSYAAKEDFIKRQMQDIQSLQAKLKEKEKTPETKPQESKLSPMPTPPVDPLEEDYSAKMQKWEREMAEWIEEREKALIAKMTATSQVKDDKAGEYATYAAEETNEMFKWFVHKHLDELSDVDQQVYLNQVITRINTIVSDPEKLSKHSGLFDKDYLKIGHVVPTKDGLTKIFTEVQNGFGPAKTERRVTTVPPPRGTQPKSPEEIQKINEKIPEKSNRPAGFAARITALKKGT